MTLNSEEIKPVALPIIEFSLFEGIHLSVYQSVTINSVRVVHSLPTAELTQQKTFPTPAQRQSNFTRKFRYAIYTRCTKSTLATTTIADLLSVSCSVVSLTAAVLLELNSPPEVSNEGLQNPRISIVQWVKEMIIALW